MEDYEQLVVLVTDEFNCSWPSFRKIVGLSSTQFFRSIHLGKRLKQLNELALDDLGSAIVKIQIIFDDSDFAIRQMTPQVRSALQYSDYVAPKTFLGSAQDLVTEMLMLNPWLHKISLSKTKQLDFLQFVTFELTGQFQALEPICKGLMALDATELFIRLRQWTDSYLQDFIENETWFKKKRTSWLENNAQVWAREKFGLEGVQLEYILTVPAKYFVPDPPRSVADLGKVLEIDSGYAKEKIQAVLLSHGISISTTTPTGQSGFKFSNIQELTQYLVFKINWRCREIRTAEFNGINDIANLRHLEAPEKPLADFCRTFANLSQPEFAVTAVRFHEVLFRSKVPKLIEHLLEIGVEAFRTQKLVSEKAFFEQSLKTDIRNGLRNGFGYKPMCDWEESLKPLASALATSDSVSRSLEFLALMEYFSAENEYVLAEKIQNSASQHAIGDDFALFVQWARLKEDYKSVSGLENDLHLDHLADSFLKTGIELSIESIDKLLDEYGPRLTIDAFQDREPSYQKRYLRQMLLDSPKQFVSTCSQLLAIDFDNPSPYEARTEFQMKTRMTLSRWRTNRRILDEILSSSDFAYSIDDFLGLCERYRKDLWLPENALARNDLLLEKAYFAPEAIKVLIEKIRKIQDAESTDTP